MTAIVVLENERDLGKNVSYPPYLDTEFWSGDPNKEGIALSGLAHHQDNLTVKDALYALMLPSGCEAANILAYHIGEGEGLARIDDFVKKMNEKAEELGAVNTNFANPHGLFETENYTTAYDMFLITKYGLDRYGFFADLVNTREYEMPPNSNEPAGYTSVNTNRLIREFAGNPYFNKFAKGVKTGGLPYYYIPDGNGGRVRSGNSIANLVSVARQNMEHGAYEYMVVTMEAPWHSPIEGHEHALHHAFNDHNALYQWAFSNFKLTDVMRKTDPIISVKVIDGVKDELLLYPQMEEDIFWALLPRNLDVESAVHDDVRLLASEVQAPVEEGAILGTVELMLARQVLGRFDLIAAESIEKTQAAQARTQFRNLFFREVEGELDENGDPVYKLKPWIVITVIGLAALVVALIVFSYVRKHQKNRDNFKKRPPNRKIRR
jgi:D-alanyl-D-alanine carboxypeptidase (penicillin-binding protein 5/6)